MSGSNETEADAELQRGLALQREGQLAEATQAYINVLRRQPNRADAPHLLGIIALQSGQPEQAVALIGRAIDCDPSVAAAHNNLGIALRRLDRNAEAVACFDRAIALAPDDAEAFNNRGIALGSIGRLADALASYDAAIALRPNYAEAHGNRGILLRRIGRPDAALASYDAAIALLSGNAELHNSRGNVLLDLMRFDAALASYDQAITLAPDYAEAHCNRGNVLAILDRAAEALSSSDAAIALRPDLAGAHAARGNALKLLGRTQAALVSYDRAIAFNPQDSGSLFGRGELLRANGQTDEAVTSLDAALSANPSHGAARLARCMAELPIMYRAEDEIPRRRARYIEALRSLTAAAKDRRISEALAGAAGVWPFYLPYQGERDVEPQRIFGHLMCDVLASAYQPARLAPRPRIGERIRLGIVSGFFVDHTVFRLFLDGWLSEIDRDRFEVIGFHTSRAADAATARAAALCDRFVCDLPSNAAWRDAIVEAAPHVLLYPEVGMDVTTAWLAAQRLAPVQCVTWGHPETTGLPTMDYFLSSDLMEPPDGAEHYTERLVRLPGLALHYAPDDPGPVSIDAAGFGLNVTVPIYWSCQSPFKYLPRHDWIFPRIAAAVGDCRLVFVNAYSEGLTEIFRDRLRSAFAAEGLDADRYCVILPKLSQRQFVAMAGLATAVLDPPAWSGGRSTLDCLDQKPAIVTMPGRFMRARHSAAILRKIGCEATVAGSLDDYVSIAARLGLDPAWRDKARQEVAERKHLAYRDAGYVRALEAFLQQAMGQL